jgi:hypothetical protein
MTKRTKKPEAKSEPTIYVRVPLGLKMRLRKAQDAERRTEKELILAAVHAYLDLHHAEAAL